METKDDERRKTCHAAVKVSKSVFFPLTKKSKRGAAGCCLLIDPWRTVNRLDNQSSKRRCIDRPITGAQRRDKKESSSKICCSPFYLSFLFFI